MVELKEMQRSPEEEVVLTLVVLGSIVFYGLASPFLLPTRYRFF